MPKDPTKNVDRYKIRGGSINEFEYDQNQEAFAANKASGEAKMIPGTPPEEKAKEMRPAVAKKPAQKATKKAAKKQAATKKAAKKAAVPARGATAKKLAARKAAKKKAAKKK